MINQLRHEARILRKGGANARADLMESAANEIERQQARINEQQQRIDELGAQSPKWISIEDKAPDVLEVRIKLIDGSEVNCWAQSDGEFYWKGGGSEMFILEHQATHWMPQPPKEAA